MNLPNKITTLRMILVIFIVAFLVMPTSWFITIPLINVSLNFLIAWILFIIASISDFLDGYIARKYNLVTDYGKFMDPIADKLLVNSTLILLTFYGDIKIPVICVVIMIGRDIIVDAIRLNAMRKNEVVAANIFGKLKTVFQMVGLILLLINDFNLSNLIGLKSPYCIGQIVIYIATFVSLLSGVIYLIQNKKVFLESK